MTYGSQLPAASCKGTNPITGPPHDVLTSQRPPLLIVSRWTLGLNT